MTSEFKTEMWAIDKIKPYEKNLRKIPDSAIEKVGLSLATNNWRQPIVVDTGGVIVAGTVRWMAARKCAMDTVLVHVADDLTPEQIRQYRIMDNRCHEETDWDCDFLKLEIMELKALEYDLSFTGFDPRQIDELLGDPNGEDAAAPALPAIPTTRLGDLWRAGGHRVLCESATKAESVARLLAGARPLLALIDPPYGVSLRPEWREEAGLGVQRQVGTIMNDDRVDWAEAYALIPSDVVYLWHAGIHSAAVALGIESAGFEIRSQIIWVKPSFVLSRGNYHWRHEPAYYCVRKGSTAHWRGDRKQSTVWEVASLNPFGGNNPDENATGHGSQKPIELMRRPILNHTERGDAIYDGFLGSGSSVIAAELTERICYGLELDPRYVDAVICRWQQLTGKQATLEGDGRSFDEIKAERSL